MVRKNMMNVLLAAVAVSAALVGYNAFIASNDDGHTASDHLSEYLSLDFSVEQEQTAGSAAVTGEQTISTTDTSTTTQSVTVAPSTTTESSVAVTQAPTTVAVASTPSGDRAETIYTVKDGDTYGCIAEKYYGSFEHWVDVVNANPVGNVGFTEYGLHVGAQLVLPAVSTAALKPTSTLCN